MIRRALRSLGPAIPAGRPAEALRAGAGALIGLLAAGAVVVAASAEVHLGLFLIAPFGASAVLIFAVPSSPLAQPWSAVVGNTASAAVALVVCALVADPMLRIPCAVGAAIATMIALRALHPPGGAVAMTVALSPDLIAQGGLWFPLCPVALGTAILVAAGMIYGRATGRRYPFRQFDQPNPQGTADPPPAERLGLSEEELEGILARYRQSLNLGVEDLARLIAAAELTAAGHRTGDGRVSRIMSRDLVTVGPRTPLHAVAQLFLRHGFTALPVVAPGGDWLGVIYQRHLLAGARFRRAVPWRRADGLAPRAARHAGQIMQRDVPVASPDMPIAALLPQMADGRCDAVPVLEEGRIVGIVTRTDLIAALARLSLGGV